MNNANNSGMRKLEPLEVSCGDADCPNGLHSYRRNGRLAKERQRPDGVCWSCGDNSMDWERIHNRDSNDIPFLMDALKTELIRYTYWNADLSDDQRAVNHARRKGRQEMRQATRHRIEKYLSETTDFDGRQTPKTGNAIFYAQHATACCCRRCMSYWYGIPEEVTLSDDDIDYFTELCMKFIGEKLPNLTEDGERVPPIRRQ